MKLLEIFRNFIDLSYTRSDGLNNSLEDIYLQNYVILRKKRASWILYFLLTGNQIVIPFSYIKLMEEFDKYQKGEFDYNLRDKAGLSKLEKFISSLLFFVRDIYSGNTSNILKDLGEICKIGTEEFRELLKRSGLNIKEIEFISVNETKRI